jgi:hypothetical protein
VGADPPPDAETDEEEMVAFQTLLLGLVFGVQPVGLMVAPQVRSVEVRLDSARIAVLTGEPWVVRCNFGDSVRPHELVAIARDGSGKEMGRVRQWVNIPRPAAEATLLLERGPQRNQVVAARLAWNETEGAEPKTVRVTLDGQELDVKDPRRFELPACDPTKAHILSAGLVFREGNTAHTQAVFGGDIGEEAQSELTAVPIVVEPGTKLPALPGMRGWFRDGDRPLQVLGVEEGPFDVVLVVDQEARTTLSEEHGARNGGLQLAENARSFPRLLLFDTGDRDADRLFITFGVPEIFHGIDGSAHIVFRTYLPVEFVTSRLRARLANGAYAVGVVGKPTLADAVASMGALAAASNRPRAVVLLRGGPAGEDGSRVTPAGARAYLNDLHVPLLVWSLTGAVDAGVWGPAVDVSSAARLDHAGRELKDQLAAERIVWLEGAHLPQRIRLAEGVEGVRLVP